MPPSARINRLPWLTDPENGSSTLLRIAGDYLRCEIRGSTAVWINIRVFYEVTPCCLLDLEDRSIMLLRKVSNHLQVYICIYTQFRERWNLSCPKERWLKNRNRWSMRNKGVTKCLRKNRIDNIAFNASKQHYHLLDLMPCNLVCRHWRFGEIHCHHIWDNHPKCLRENKRNIEKIKFEELITYTNSYVQDGRRQEKDKTENKNQIPKMEQILISLNYEKKKYRNVSIFASLKKHVSPLVLSRIQTKWRNSSSPTYFKTII